MADDERASGLSGFRAVVWLLVALVGVSLAGAVLLLFGTNAEAMALMAALVVAAVLLLLLLDFR
jgi:hypothetical protein